MALVLERGGQAQRLKRVFLVQSSEPSVRITRPVVTLDAQVRHAVVRSGAVELGIDDRQADASGDIVCHALRHAYPSHGLELQQVARRIRAVRQRVGLAVEDDGLLLLRAGQGEPLPCADHDGSLFAEGADQPVDLCVFQRLRRCRLDVGVDAGRQDTESSGAILADGEQESCVVVECDPALPADTLSRPALGEQTREEGVRIHLSIAQGQRQMNGDGKPALVQPGGVVGKAQDAIRVFP